MNIFQFFITCKSANNATHSLKLGKKRRETSKRDYYIICTRVIIKAIIIIMSWVVCCNCHTLQHTGTLCNTLQHSATHCNALQHTATHCNTLQHTATHYSDASLYTTLIYLSWAVCYNSTVHLWRWTATNTITCYLLEEQTKIHAGSPLRCVITVDHSCQFDWNVSVFAHHCGSFC